MQIKIWLRPKADGTMTLRIDEKYENLDTPRIHAWGQKLIRALSGNAREPSPIRN